MRKTWAPERKWIISKMEDYFEQLCRDNDYDITGYQEYISKTMFRIEKNGVEIEYCIYHDRGGRREAELAFWDMVRCYEMKLEYYRLMRV